MSSVVTFVAPNADIVPDHFGLSPEASELVQKLVFLFAPPNSKAVYAADLAGIVKARIMDGCTVLNALEIAVALVFPGADTCQISTELTEKDFGG